ncbi:hypothetical protein VNO80_24959 [Phaseolus coccineus]|uniref:Uncharacterized protein n=1 Tax=Phaseolus coccineus TaxID=3886 RepID=A0AAN9QSV5_PHACN
MLFFKPSTYSVLPCYASNDFGVSDLVSPIFISSISVAFSRIILYCSYLLLKSKVNNYEYYIDRYKQTYLSVDPNRLLLSTCRSRIWKP